MSRIESRIACLARSLFFAIAFFCAFSLHAQGDIYLVFGSDTSIWDGLNVSDYICHYKPETYSAPSSNAARVISEGFRARLLDSFNQPMPLTWWMHGGNVFRHADNCDVPLPNTIAMHLMKRYHGQAISRVGDELSLHYHTWDWTDENGDGLYCWNQARNFEQCREDFNLTLCHYLLEEEVFPVSFRSGWHYMDNNWQAYLDELLPFCLHDAWPSKRTYDDEPTDNIYDWSLSSSAWVPFHPSLENYQLPGGAKGWNVRCAYLGGVTPSLIDQMFARAAAGTDQLACLWSHLPETDFPDQLLRAHEIIVAAGKRYPGVRFHYKTAVDAFQSWLHTSDTQPPALTFVDKGSAEYPVFLIQTDEPIFQKQPFVAIKDIYNRYQIVPCSSVGANTWEAVSPLARRQLAKAGVALTDTVGNQALQLIRYLPEEIFLDNESDGYRELIGQFVTQDSYAWGTDARTACVAGGDSAVIRYQLPVSENRNYQLFCQFAPAANPAESLTVVLSQHGQIVWRKGISGAMAAKRWHRISASELDPAGDPALYFIAHNPLSTICDFCLDGVRISALIPDRQLAVAPNFCHFGETSLFTRVEKSLTIENNGKEPLTISSITTQQKLFRIDQPSPLTLPAFSSITLSIHFYADKAVTLTDTLVIESDDPVTPHWALPLSVNALSYFVTVDNDDPADYFEFGDWHDSVVEAYGPSSRFAYLSSSQGIWAQFRAIVQRSGTYRLSFLLPKTENASDHALYKVLSQGLILDSLFVNQNTGSGTWVTLGEYELSSGKPVWVQIIHAGGQTSGAVLRTDAVRFTLIDNETGLAGNDTDQRSLQARLLPNYPNPFNGSTTIRYYLPAAAAVHLDVYDIQGRRVRRLERGHITPGEHVIVWDGRNETENTVASGPYIVTLFGEEFFLSQRIFMVR